MAVEPEASLVRWTVTVPAPVVDIAVVELFECFPGGLQEELDGVVARLSAYLPAGEEPVLPEGYTAVAEAVAPGWRDAWRDFHRPVRIGAFWVGPPWLEPDPGTDAVVIEPALAFGTGAHGSTRAAATVLMRLAGAGAICDVGCGSGVLAIIAGRLGWGPIEATDHDPHAVEATIENAAINDVELRAWRADALVDPLPAAPVMLANLQLEILEPLFRRDDLPGTVIVSGLLERERFLPDGWVVADEEVCDGWRARRLVRATAP
jgi:ribosomal protein L11 methyltransferase